MNKIIYSVLFTVGIIISIQAQDRGVYSQAHLYPVFINPAYTGFSGSHELLFGYKNSHATFADAPKTFTLSYDGLVADRVGLGAMLFSENLGELQRYRAQLSYAYQFEVNEFKMSAGLTTEFQQNRLSNRSLLSDFYEPGDAVLEEAIDGIQFFDATIGFYAEYQERFIFGFSVPNLIRARIDQATVMTPDTDNTFFKYFTLLLGHRFIIEDYNFKVEPSILLRRLKDSPFFADLNVKLSFLDDQLIGGLGYSLGAGNKVAFLIGTRVNNFRLSYSYDIGLGGFQVYNNGSHELTIGLSLNRTPKRVKLDDDLELEE